MSVGARALPFPPMATTAKARRSRGRAAGPEFSHLALINAVTHVIADDQRGEPSAVFTEMRSVGAAG